jgi:hypothetical protein
MFGAWSMTYCESDCFLVDIEIVISLPIFKHEDLVITSAFVQISNVQSRLNSFEHRLQNVSQTSKTK